MISPSELRRLLPKGTPLPGEASQMQSVLPHELGHLWFEGLLYPELRSDSEGQMHYSSPLPDWLDEAGAVTMEAGALTRSRREQFRKLAATGALIPLQRFLTMEHPVLAANREAMARIEKAAGRGGAAVTVLKAGDVEGGQAAADFYAQVLGFADYLAARSESAQALVRIGRVLRKSPDPLSWIPGNDLGVPTALPALEQDWLRWAGAAANTR